MRLFALILPFIAACGASGSAARPRASDACQTQFEIRCGFDPGEAGESAIVQCVDGKYQQPARCKDKTACTDELSDNRVACASGLVVSGAGTPCSSDGMTTCDWALTEVMECKAGKWQRKKICASPAQCGSSDAGVDCR